MQIKTKLPYVEQHIFSYMSGLSNQHKAVNLSQGFPNFEPDQRLQDLVAKHINASTHQYSPIAGVLSLREKIAEKIKATHQIMVDPENEITITVGATEAIYNTVNAFVWPGDEVILIEPCYDCYRPAVDLAQGRAVVYKMRAPNYRVDWAAFEKLITEKTRMICINTPHNPTGTIFKKEDLLQLSRLVEGTDIVIMSDEVYEHIVFDDATHESPLKYPELRKRTVSVSSFGKTFHVTGWRLGYCVAPPELTKEIRKLHQNTVFDVCHPLQAVLTEYMSLPDTYNGFAALFEQKRNLLIEVMQTTRLKALPCEGSYFQLYDYSAISTENDFDFCVRLIKEYGIAAIPVSRLYSDQQDDRVIRFCFAKTDDLLVEAGKRLERL